MGEYVIRVPDVGEGVAEVELVSWMVEPGDTVTKHQVLAEVMTDKANVEIPAPTAGVVARTNGQAGDVLAVGSDLIELTIPGDVAPADVADAAPPVATPTAPGASERPTVADPPAKTRPHSGQAAVPAPPSPARAGRRPSAAPAVRSRAKSLGIDLHDVNGSGPDGRILHEDLDAFRPPTERRTAQNERRQHVRPTTSAGQPPRIEPMIGMRRRIAERMVTAATTIPHITYVEEVDMTNVLALRQDLNERSSDDAPKLSILPFLVRAICLTVPDFPYMNAHVDDAADEIQMFDSVDVGVASQTDRGLVVPVLRGAQDRSLWDLAARIAELASAARDGSISATDLSGSTITISSLGELGGVISTPIINKPETAIVGVNKLTTRPVWMDDRFVPRQMMNLSSSFDHRVIDGFDAASFIGRVTHLLEQPALLFIDVE